MEENESVYCKKCKYKVWHHIRGQYECLHKSNIGYFYENDRPWERIGKKRRKIIDGIDYKNKNNDCEYYKRRIFPRILKGLSIAYGIYDIIGYPDTMDYERKE